ncbi:MAG: pyridoxine 5'-phosphate synthase [Rhodospirillales bacterium]|nr:MAG: pyridoxine 5'-phosphate synthase [Rhodospirillales bacterium]
MARYLRLGVNIDHVATVRNARGGSHPDPVRAAVMAIQAGADGITAHLREDRRHITDADLDRLMREVRAPFNLEMAATDEMLRIALAHRPHAVCLVPERREERTTEGGLDAVAGPASLAPAVRTLREAGIRVSLFIEPTVEQVEAAAALGAPAVELHTGAYCHAAGDGAARELARIVAAAARCDALGLECHAGHGLTYDNVAPIAAIEPMAELNIGHFLVGEAVFIGLEASIRRMRAVMEGARAAGATGLIGLSR